MPTRALTVAAVDRIKPPSEGQLDVFDKGFPGLALRVSYGGAKAWIYFYRLHGTKLRRLTLGRYPAMDLAEARSAWQDARKAVGNGENPKHRRPPAADSFAAIADEWLKRDQSGNRSYKEVKRVLERDMKPVFDGRMFSSITRRDVVELIDAIADRGAVTLARRVHAHLHRLFRWSVGRGILELNPMTDLPKPGNAVKRDRVLTDAELAAIWHGAEKIGWPFGPALQLLILTAARREEITALRWSEIGDDSLIELRAERTKNGEPRDVPLSSVARSIIKALPRIDGSELVFTTTGERPVSGWSKAKGFVEREAQAICGKPLAPWRLHDLRRTAATGMQRLGIGLQVVEAILGHVSGSRAGIVGVYQRHSYDAEKGAALEAWAHHVVAIAAGKAGKVIVLNARAS
jgi:integrase